MTYGDLEDELERGERRACRARLAYAVVGHDGDDGSDVWVWDEDEGEAKSAKREGDLNPLVDGRRIVC